MSSKFSFVSAFLTITNQNSERDQYIEKKYLNQSEIYKKSFPDKYKQSLSNKTVKKYKEDFNKYKQ